MMLAREDASDSDSPSQALPVELLIFTIGASSPTTSVLEIAFVAWLFGTENPQSRCKWPPLPLSGAPAAALEICSTFPLLFSSPSLKPINAQTY
ncbi:unnamed protein product [Lathyrus sativus]|nr:unnamed protein product [Lathyrus sativus]